MLEVSTPQDSNDSVEGPNSRKSSSTLRSKEEATSVSHGRITTNAEFNSCKQPVISIFYERKVVSELRMNFVKEAWAKIHSKLIELTAEHASSRG